MQVLKAEITLAFLFLRIQTFKYHLKEESSSASEPFIKFSGFPGVSVESSGTAPGSDKSQMILSSTCVANVSPLAELHEFGREPI